MEKYEANKEGNHEPPVFSAEQQLLFQTRYEEGYNLHDPDYQQWLTIHHPESVSAEQPLHHSLYRLLSSLQQLDLGHVFR